jgi:hypothetical protein
MGFFDWLGSLFSSKPEPKQAAPRRTRPRVAEAREPLNAPIPPKFRRVHVGGSWKQDLNTNRYFQWNINTLPVGEFEVDLRFASTGEQLMTGDGAYSADEDGDEDYYTDTYTEGESASDFENDPHEDHHSDAGDYFPFEYEEDVYLDDGSVYAIGAFVGDKQIGWLVRWADERDAYVHWLKRFNHAGIIPVISGECFRAGSSKRIAVYMHSESKIADDAYWKAFIKRSRQQYKPSG